MEALLLLLILAGVVSANCLLKSILCELRKRDDFGNEDAAVLSAKKEVDLAKGRIPQAKEVK
jgi:hypothetical protein